MLFTDEFIQKIQSNMRMPPFLPFYLSPQWQPVFTPNSAQEAHYKTLNLVCKQVIDHYVVLEAKRRLTLSATRI